MDRPQPEGTVPSTPLTLDQQFKRWCEEHAATAWTRGTEWWQITALNLYGDDNVRAAFEAGRGEVDRLQKVEKAARALVANTGSAFVYDSVGRSYQVTSVGPVALGALLDALRATDNPQESALPAEPGNEGSPS